MEEDEWIRVHLEKGDLLVIPKFTTHRFTVTPQVRALPLSRSCRRTSCSCSASSRKKTTPCRADSFLSLPSSQKASTFLASSRVQRRLLLALRCLFPVLH